MTCSLGRSTISSAAFSCPTSRTGKSSSSSPCLPALPKTEESQLPVSFPSSPPRESGASSAAAASAVFSAPGCSPGGVSDAPEAAMSLIPGSSPMGSISPSMSPPPLCGAERPRSASSRRVGICDDASPVAADPDPSPPPASRAVPPAETDASGGLPAGWDRRVLPPVSHSQRTMARSSLGRTGRGSHCPQPASDIRAACSLPEERSRKGTAGRERSPSSMRIPAMAWMMSSSPSAPWKITSAAGSTA